MICIIHKYREPTGKYTSAHCPRVQLNSFKGLQKYHFYSDSPSQNITVLTEKSGKGSAGHGAIFQWVDVILDLLVVPQRKNFPSMTPRTRMIRAA